MPNAAVRPQAKFHTVCAIHPATIQLSGNPILSNRRSISQSQEFSRSRDSSRSIKPRSQRGSVSLERIYVVFGLRRRQAARRITIEAQWEERRDDNRADADRRDAGECAGRPGARRGRDRDGIRHFGRSYRPYRLGAQPISEPSPHRARPRGVAGRGHGGGLRPADAAAGRLAGPGSLGARQWPARHDRGASVELADAAAHGFQRCAALHLACAYQQATGDWGSWDARRAFSGVTKHVMQAHDPIAAVQATQLAIKHALAGQPGPVAVLYAHDSLAGSVAPVSQPMLYPTRHYLPSAPPPAETRQVEAAAAALLAAQNPVLIAGNGV